MPTDRVTALVQAFEREAKEEPDSWRAHRLRMIAAGLTNTEDITPEKEAEYRALLALDK